MSRITLVFFSLFFCSLLTAQIQVDPTVTAEDAVNNVLLGSGVVAENITFSGDLDQIGTFAANGSNMPIGEGVAIGTGNVNLASSQLGFGTENDPGPGGNNGGGSGLGGGNFGVNDADLEVIANVGVNDAAILEFDFEATGDSIQFNFVFASEEYPEYVCGTVNDAFGFFLSGPGLDGGGVFENNAVNLAQIPGTDPPVPVTINSVNPGVVGSNGTQPNCDDIDLNWPDYNVFYIANDTQTTDPNVIEYDGFTVVLTASAQVECGETYHIKMAIADGGDTAFDSAVFLQAGSFESNAVFIQSTAAIAGNLIFAGDSVVVEGCNDAQFSFIRPNADEGDTLHFEILGEALNGTDYTQIADSVVLEAGETTVNIPIIALDDGIAEGYESLIIRYIYENSCMEMDTSTSVLYIADYIQPTVSLDDVTVPCPGEAVEIIPETTGFGGFTYLWDDTSENPTLTVSPDETTDYSVTVTDVCGTEIMGTVTVNVVDWPDLVLTPNEATSTCPGDPIQIGVTVEGGSPGYTYDWFIGGSDNTNTVSPEITTDYTVTVSDQCESQQVTVTATVIPWPGLDITPIDGSSGCPGSPVNIGVDVSGGFPGYTYNWLQATSTESTATVSPLTSGQYTVTVSDQCSSQNATVNVDVDILAPITADYDTLICAGDQYTFTELAGGTGEYNFSTIETSDTLIVSENGTYTGFVVGFYDIVVFDDCPTATPLIAEVEVEVCDTFLPNVFTPDSDGAEGSVINATGLNERFYIIGIENFRGSELLVYNRWGSVVFEDGDYRNTWTGKDLSGNDLSEGTYFYVFNRSDGESYNGSITLLRKK